MSTPEPPDSDRLGQRLDRATKVVAALILGWALVCGVLYLAGVLGAWAFVRGALEPPLGMLGGSLLAWGRWSGAALIVLAVLLGVWPWVFT